MLQISAYHILVSHDKLDRERVQMEKPACKKQHVMLCLQVTLHYQAECKFNNKAACFTW